MHSIIIKIVYNSIDRSTPFSENQRARIRRMWSVLVWKASVMQRLGYAQKIVCMLGILVGMTGTIAYSSIGIAEGLELIIEDPLTTPVKLPGQASKKSTHGEFTVKGWRALDNDGCLVYEGAWRHQVTPLQYIWLGRSRDFHALIGPYFTNLKVWQGPRNTKPIKPSKSSTNTYQRYEHEQGE